MQVEQNRIPGGLTRMSEMSYSAASAPRPPVRQHLALFERNPFVTSPISLEAYHCP